VSPEEAEKHISTLNPEQRALYESNDT